MDTPSASGPSTGWWYNSNGEAKGPISEQELLRLLANRTVGPKSLVWKEGMESWQQVDQVNALAQVMTSMPPELPSIPPAAGTHLSETPAAKSTSPRTPIRKITTILALLLLLAVWLVVGTYVYANPAEGIGYVFAQGSFVLLIVGAIAWFNRKGKRPF